MEGRTTCRRFKQTAAFERSVNRRPSRRFPPQDWPRAVPWHWTYWKLATEDLVTYNALLQFYPPVKGYIHITLARRIRQWRKNATAEGRALWCTDCHDADIADIFNLRRLFGEEPVPQACHVPHSRFEEEVLETYFSHLKCVLYRHHLWDTPGLFYVDDQWRPRLGVYRFGSEIPEHKVYYYCYVTD